MLLELIKRVLRSLLEILVWIDQGIGLLLSIPFYIIFGAPKPDASFTISAVVGIYAEEGKRWALIAEWFLDRFFYIFERKFGHCRRARKYSEACSRSASDDPNE
jgi:hypothetical protein